MREHGQVITVRDGAVDIRMQVSAACGGCSVCSRGGGETVMRDVADPLGVTVGDEVEVTIPDTIRSRAAVAVFVLPVFAMLGGYLAGFLLGRWLGWSPDMAGLVVGLVSANIALIGVRAAERRLKRNDRFSPQVSAILARGHERT
ncbi:MAG: SoxR reducing system RseC family protein [Aeromicrobium sp.]|jgi:sigma-E factor negative regulatory protein RseC|nr:SoxR reducing system RseC family protein [Aeromicrobium sp.]